MAWARKASPDYKLLGVHTLTTGFTTSATHTTYQDEGLTLSVPYLANRILRVTFSSNPYPSGGLQSIRWKLLRGSTTLGIFQTLSAELDTGAVTTKMYAVTFNGPASAATETFKVQMKAASSNTAVTSFGGDINGEGVGPRLLTVEDLGPQ